LPLDSGIPGTSTFTKPEDAPVRDFDKGKDESIYRTDNADDLLKDRDRIDINEDNADKSDGIGAWGKGEWDKTGPKTRYPHRDGIPNAHNASAEIVVELWKLSSSRTLRVYPDSRIKIAVRSDDVISGLNPKVTTRSQKCAVSTKRADVKNLRWIFSVNCGNGAKVVKVKASREKPQITKLSKMDVDLKCSCPAWRWLGPEHHAKREEYLDGKPRGTASVPVIRDPTGINKVCKHVAAVIAHTKAWDVPAK
jgi:hypothetical protein